MDIAVDCILTGGQVIDGTGAPPLRADVAFSDGLIVAMGDLHAMPAQERIDVSGMIVAPGFIDVHTHDDYACIGQPDMTAKISQGVTTVVVGNCGISVSMLAFDGAPPEPFNLLGDAEAFRFNTFQDYVDGVNKAQPSVNVAALIGHSTLRRICMDDLERAANQDEIEKMCELLAGAMQAGATGMSSGVYYQPSRASSAEELVALARVVSAAGGVYATHIRDEYDDIAQALREAFDTANEGEVGLVISHHKCAGVKNWGRSIETLALIDKATERQEVGMDCYPYTAGSSVINPALADGEIPILINSSVPHPEMAGRYLQDIANAWGVSQQQAAERLVPGYACFFQIDETDMHRILSHESCMVGSDGLPNAENPHPRLWGTFPRVLGHLVREKQLFALHHAIAKMTGLSARRFGLSRRGVIASGMVADITVFNPETIIDCATYENPKQLSMGIEEVFVNGIHAWSQGAATGNRAGVFVGKQG